MRRPVLILAAAAAALSIAACGKEAPGGADAPPPADAPATAPDEPAAAPAPTDEFSQGFGARGTEPFWRADVVGDKITVTRPDSPALTATNAALGVNDTGAVWTGQAGMVSVVLTVSRAGCSDGMSDLKYDYAAELRIGDETFKGCGFRADAEPREGQ